MNIVQVERVSIQCVSKIFCVLLAPRKFRGLGAGTKPKNLSNPIPVTYAKNRRELFNNPYRIHCLVLAAKEEV